MKRLFTIYNMSDRFEQQMAESVNINKILVSDMSLYSFLIANTKVFVRTYKAIGIYINMYSQVS